MLDGVIYIRSTILYLGEDVGMQCVTHASLKAPFDRFLIPQTHMTNGLWPQNDGPDPFRL